jgi:hypothetical protein
VRSATSFALGANLDESDIKKIAEIAKNPAKICINMTHFEAALKEVKPLFGTDDQDLRACIPNGIIPFGVRLPELLSVGSTYVRQASLSRKISRVSFLLHGLLIYFPSIIFLFKLASLSLPSFHFS